MAFDYKKEYRPPRWTSTIEEQGYENDFSDTRMHHEIYLSDPGKVQPEKYRTVIRHPIRKK